jgi:superfamily II DNA or RNA helicase
MIQRNKCICAAQTGFGKTYLGCTAICNLLLKYKDTHAILLVPQKAVKAFKKELTQKLRVSFNTLTSSKPEMNPNSRITIITHTSLKKYLPYIEELKNKGYKLLLLVDEAHILSSKDSKIYQYVSNIRYYFSVCWFMTATPLKNNIEGLFWLINMLDPTLLKNWNYFKYRYLVIDRHPTTRVVGKGKNKHKMNIFEEEIVGYKNLDELKSILNQIIIIKQKKYNLKFIYHKTTLSDEEVKPYLEAGKGLLRDSAKDSFAVRMHDLQMVVDNINDEYKVINKMSSKEQLFIKLIITKMKDNHPTLVYCDYNELVDRLDTLLKATKKYTGVKQILKITGDVSQKDREKVEDLIDPNTVVLLTSAGTESINLQKADSFIFYDIPFSILTFLQAVGRVTRMDSKFNEQYIHILECTGTIDSYKRALVQINGGLIMNMFGKMETLPLEVGQIDKNITRQLKQGLLWCFRQNKLLTEDELNKILQQKKN